MVYLSCSAGRTHFARTKILLSNLTVKNAPAKTICTNWNIAANYEKDDYLKRVFTFWKNPYLPSYLQNLHLQIINHKLKLNAHLKHLKHLKIIREFLVTALSAKSTTLQTPVRNHSLTFSWNVHQVSTH